MFGGNNNNVPIPLCLDDSLPYIANASNQQQLCGNLNYLGNKHNLLGLPPNKRSRESEAASMQQKLQISLNHGIFHDEADRLPSMLNQNPVSTGLKLSYDDDERNSTITSASGSTTAVSSIFSSLNSDIKVVLDRQKEELNQYIKTQEENLAKGLRDIKQRHMASFLTALENSVRRKLREKDIELENINRKNRELSERVKQVAAEAQNWCYIAKYNESVANVLKSNLHKAMQGSDHGKEGFGENDLDDAISHSDPNNYLSTPGAIVPSTSTRDTMVCKSCNMKEVSILLMPCRHLCLCKGCEALVNVCPVCHQMTTASFEVYLS